MHTISESSSGINYTYFITASGVLWLLNGRLIHKGTQRVHAALVPTCIDSPRRICLLFFSIAVTTSQDNKQQAGEWIYTCKCYSPIATFEQYTKSEIIIARASANCAADFERQSMRNVLSGYSRNNLKLVMRLTRENHVFIRIVCARVLNFFTNLNYT